MTESPYQILSAVKFLTLCVWKAQRRFRTDDPSICNVYEESQLPLTSPSCQLESQPETQNNLETFSNSDVLTLYKFS